MDKNKIHATRRTYLKHAISAGAVTTGLSSTAVARSEPGASDDTSAESVGIKRAVRKLTKKGKFNEATKLLDRHDVAYSHSELSFDPEASNMTSEDEVSAEGGPTGGVFDKSDSEIDFLMYHNSGRLYTVEIMFDHTPKALDTDCIAPNDALAVTYSGARWQYEAGSKNVISGDLREFDSRDDGVKIEWYYDAYPSTGETSGHFATLLRKAKNYENDPSNVWAHYKHIYTPFYKTGCYNGLLGSNISLSAGQVSISFDANDWEKNDLQAL